MKNIKAKKEKVDNKKFFEIVKQGFSQKRKQLKNNLKNKEVGGFLEDLDLKTDIRAQELSVQDWVNLVNKIGK